MSLLFPERVTFWLTRQAVTVLHRGQAPRGCREPALRLALQDEPAWVVLARALQQYRHKHKQSAQFEVLLSNAYVQALCLPAQSALNTEDEEALFVRFRFEEVFGEVARTWALSWDNGLAWRSVLAHAMPRDLLQGLQALFEAQSEPLLGVQAWWTHFLNTQWRQRMPERCLLVEGGQAMVLQQQAGQWQRLHQMRMPENLAATQLQALLQRERMLSMPATAEWVVYAPAPLALQAPGVHFVACTPEDTLTRRHSAPGSLRSSQP